MPKILVCTNLLGDSLYLLRPVKLFMEKHPEEVVAMVVQDSLAGELFKKSFPNMLFYNDTNVAVAELNAEVVKLNAGKAGEIAFNHSREPGGRQLHISEGYAKILGVDLEGSLEPLHDWQHNQPVQKNRYVLICPFSRSCSRHSGEKPNKTLDDWKWEHIIRSVRKHGNNVKIIGAPTDHLSKVSVPENDYMTASNLDELETMIREASLVITLDNGIGHLASTLYSPTIILWPIVSCREFIAPLFSPNTTYIEMDPNKASPGQLLSGIRRMMVYLEHHTSEKIEATS